MRMHPIGAKTGLCLILAQGKGAHATAKGAAGAVAGGACQGPGGACWHT